MHVTTRQDSEAWGDTLARPDLNFLFTLEVLLAEGSVVRAARRLRLSPSAMSRSLERLRHATGDPLLVRAVGASWPRPERSSCASPWASWFATAKLPCALLTR